MCTHDPAAVQPPWLSIVGIGADGWEGLAPAARDAVRGAGLVVGGRRHLALLPAVAGQERMAWPSPLHAGFERIRASRGRPVCVLASGDPFWYGVGATLARAVDPAEMRVHPAPSAFSLAAARLGWPLQETACLSVHGRTLERVIPWLQAGARLLVLSWDSTTPQALAGLLRECGFGSSRLVVLERLGAPDESRIEATADEWEQARVADLNTVALECRAAPEARVIARTAGRPEALFDHDGQITKREVRAVALALLAPGAGERLWDVGAGSGAIAIEWLLAHADNKAVTFEAHAERAERIRHNARALGVPGLECVAGRAPEALADQAPPDAVFIGGGLTTPGLFDACWQALPPGGRLVASGVTVEAEALLAELSGRHGGELSRIAVTRAEPLGKMTGWAPLRPITLWCAVHP